MNFIFSLQVSVLTWVLLAVSVLALIWIAVPYGRRLRRVTRTVRRHTAEANVASEDCVDTAHPDRKVTDACTEPVSVIVRARDEATSLTRLLPVLLAQEYAPGFEIIVVNEGASEPTTQVVDQLRMHHRNLYLTFTPDGAYNLSSKKLAIMLGVKAARNRIVVLTTAGAQIGDPQWLARITRHFECPATEVVLAPAVPVTYDNDPDAPQLQAVPSFPYAYDTLTWLSAALSGNPYRGHEASMAITSDVFFRHKGFSQSLNLVDGLDDVFVNEIVTPVNTVVELSDRATVGMTLGRPAQDLNAWLCSHRFTGRQLPRGPRRWMASGLWAFLAGIVAAVAAAIIGLPNLLPAAVAVVLIAATAVTLTLTLRSPMRALQLRTRAILPAYMMTPIHNIMRDLRVRRHPRKYYTYHV